MPLLLEARPMHPSLRPDTEATEYAVAHIRTARNQAVPRVRLSVVLVLDVSSSMRGEPLDHVIRSVERLLPALGPQVRLGVVAFDGSARTVAPLQPLQAAACHQARRAVRALRSGRGTNISAGLSHAALLFPGREPDERQLVVLMTDGQPSVGTVDPAVLGEEVTRIRGREVAVTTLGFGAHHSEDLLLALAQAGGGHYSYISDPLLVLTRFARAIGAQMDVVAEDVRLTLRPGPGVTIARVLGHPEVAVGADGLEVRLPDRQLGDELDVVAELRVRTPAASTELLCLLRLGLTCRATETGASFSCGDEVAVELEPDGAGTPEPVAAAAVLLAQAEERREEARGLADRGDFAGAAALLGQMLATLRSAADQAGDRPGGERLRSAVAILAEEVQFLERQPATGESAGEYRRQRKIRHQERTAGPSGSLGYRGSAGTSARSLVRDSLPVPSVPAQLLRMDAAGERAYPLSHGEVRIGRAADNDIVLGDATVSRYHATVVYEGDGFYVLNGSWLGTYVNDKRIERCKLENGDRIRIGDRILRFQC